MWWFSHITPPRYNDLDQMNAQERVSAARDADTGATLMRGLSSDAMLVRAPPPHPLLLPRPTLQGRSRRRRRRRMRMWLTGGRVARAVTVISAVASILLLLTQKMARDRLFGLLVTAYPRLLRRHSAGHPTTTPSSVAAYSHWPTAVSCVTRPPPDGGGSFNVRSTVAKSALDSSAAAVQPSSRGASSTRTVPAASAQAIRKHPPSPASSSLPPSLAAGSTSTASMLQPAAAADPTRRRCAWFELTPRLPAGHSLPRCTAPITWVRRVLPALCLPRTGRFCQLGGGGLCQLRAAALNSFCSPRLLGRKTPRGGEHPADHSTHPVRDGEHRGAGRTDGCCRDPAAVNIHPACSVSA
jgi:hypothetical protein